LARREVRRRWGRTLLVMILVAVPVFGMTVITTLVRTSQTTPARDFAHQFGAANLVAQDINAKTPSGGWPVGTRVVQGREAGDVGLLAPNGTARLAQVTDFDLNNPIAKGVVLLREGRFPHSAGEALVSPKIARAFHLKVGDTLKLREPAWTEHIVGIGLLASNWSDGLLAVRGNELATNVQLGDGPPSTYTLVQLPGHPTNSELAKYTPPYISAASEEAASHSQRAIDWILVAGMIALAIAGIVIAGAFAVGARRQLVTLGQLSANGADGSLLRRTLSLQGMLCGLLGTAVGIIGGVMTLVLIHARFDGWIHRDIGPYAWSTRDLVAIAFTGVAAATIAAYLPSRSAARVPVLSALAGRRPLGALPRSMVAIGLALFSGGVLILVLVAAASHNGGGDGLALAAVLGGLLVLAGACCVSPVIVASLSPLARRLRRAGRVAARSLVRSRARSAAVVMALVAINAGAIAISTAFASRTTPKFDTAPFMPNNALIVQREDPAIFGNSGPTQPIPDFVNKTLRTILPDATWSERREVKGATIDHRAEIGRVINGKAVAVVDSSVMTVADPPILRVIGLAPSDAATLQRVGVLVLALPPDQGAPTSGVPPTVQVGRGGSARTIPAALAAHPARASASTSILITPAKAAELGLHIIPAGEIAINPKPFNESQRASIDALMPSLMFGSMGSKFSNSNATPVDILWAGPASSGISANIVQQIVLAIVVFIALLVLAMSLALSAAETRDERDVLVALGAPPRTMRGVAGWKAGLLAMTAAVIAVPTGFIPVAFAFWASVHSGDQAHLRFPWVTVLELVILAPLIAALVAAIGSTIAQRVRPTQMSTFATD
jgi:putative ABC transport system permease protein